MAADAPTAHTAPPTWLCPDAAARERLVDMDERLRRPRSIAFGLLGLILVGSVGLLGWLPIALMAVLIAAFSAASRLQARLARPEYAIALSWVLAQVFITVMVGMTGGLTSYGVLWLLIPLVTLPARFGPRVVAAGVAFTAALLAIVGLTVEPDNDLPELFGFVCIAGGIAGVALLSSALQHSDLEHRTEAVVDGLTGMLNRRALHERLAELAAQAAHSQQPIAVIAGDLDHFKQVNDTHGHATGDAVLVDVAYRLRKRLRAFDLAYRSGGEEFLVVLPGATVERAAELAEELRAAIAADPVAGLAITMSFGVAGSDGGAFDADAVLAAADVAMYDAKAEGRNRVVAQYETPARA